MNSFDLIAIGFLSKFSLRYVEFDRFVELISTNNMFKGGVLLPIVWWAWFKAGERQQSNRLHLVAMLASCAVSMLLARVLATVLPFRERPVFSEELNSFFPKGIVQVALDNWSSFPSDHAALFFTLSTGLLFVSKPAGIFAICYTALFIGFPRIFLGLHFPTDVIAGAIIGIAVAVLGNIVFVKSRYLKKITEWSYEKPAFFYPLFFLLSFQLSELFYSVRILGKATLNLLH